MFSSFFHDFTEGEAYFDFLFSTVFQSFTSEMVSQ